MRIILRALLLLAIAVFGGGIAFLATWDIPAPTRQIEQTIPNDQFDF